MIVSLGAIVAIALFGGPPGSPPLYKNLGNHHRQIAANNPRSQQYFNQGLRLLYAFNHAEARRAFLEAARLSPDCSICYWGAALSLGPHINAGMDSASGVEAYRLLQRAAAVTLQSNPIETALIGALRERYAPIPQADRRRLDEAYARAMGELARRFSTDQDIAVLYAEALMDLSPWDYWDRETGEPRFNTITAQEQLERVIKVNPNHPGACHLYIHLVEAVAPEKALSCAERLASLMPGAGHIVHMPPHIYIRLGRYADAIESNIHAVHQDEEYLKEGTTYGVYREAYYPHNYHFLALAATFAGKSAQAIEAAKKTAETTPQRLAQRQPMLEPFIQYPFLTLVTFGRWDDVLALPMPLTALSYSRAMAHYARGVAFAAKGQFAEAQAALDTLKQIAAGGITAYASVGWTTPSTNLQIAEHALAGEIASRSGKLEDGIAHFRAAMKIEDAQLYTEPPDWYYPIRHSLGAVLLKHGQPAEAEAVYLQDLKRFQENGWALFGLAQALRAQGKNDEATQVEERFKKAWAGADVTLTASRF